MQVLFLVLATSISLPAQAQQDSQPAAEPAAADVVAVEEAEPAEAVSTTSEEIIAAPAAAPGEAPSITREEKSVALGLSLRELLGYGGLAVGGVLAIEYDAVENTVTVTTKQSRAPGRTMFGIGLGVAAAGAFLLWVEPALNLGLMASVGPSVQPGGGAVAISGTF